MHRHFAFPIALGGVSILAVVGNACGQKLIRNHADWVDSEGRPISWHESGNGIGGNSWGDYSRSPEF